MNKFALYRLPAALLAIGLSGLAATQLHADSYYWKDGTTGNWDDAANWTPAGSPGFPGAGDIARLSWSTIYTNGDRTVLQLTNYFNGDNHEIKINDVVADTITIEQASNGIYIAYDDPGEVIFNTNIAYTSGSSAVSIQVEHPVFFNGDFNGGATARTLTIQTANSSGHNPWGNATFANGLSGNFTDIIIHGYSGQYVTFNGADTTSATSSNTLKINTAINTAIDTGIYLGDTNAIGARKVVLGSLHAYGNTNTQSTIATVSGTIANNFLLFNGQATRIGSNVVGTTNFSGTFDVENGEEAGHEVNTTTFAALDAGTTVNVTGVIQSIVNSGVDARPINVDGPGVVQFSGNNTFSGNLTVNSGSLVANSSTALGFGGKSWATGTNGAIVGVGTTSVETGATLDLNGQTINEPIELNGGALLNNALTTATLNNGVAGVELVDVGSYSVNPTVTLTGGDGAGATATASIISFANPGSQIMTLTNAGAGYTSAPTVNFVGGTGSGAVANAVLSSLTLNAGDNTIGGSGDLNLTAAVGGTGGFTKTGAGKLILAASNNYAGATAVTEGTLQVDGAITVSNVTVSGGTLQGVGNITNNVLVNAAGNLAPGDSIGELTVGAATIDGTLTIELAAASSSDLLTVTSAMDITNATLDLIDLGGAFDGSTYIIATYGSLTGSQFASVDPLLAANNYGVDYNYLSGSQIALVQIPEPATLMLLTVSGLMLIQRRKHQ